VPSPYELACSGRFPAAKSESGRPSLNLVNHSRGTTCRQWTCTARRKDRSWNSV